MTSYSLDDKLMYHYFQDNLSGVSLERYMQQKQSHIHTWKDLAMEFLKHYQYNLEMALTRIQLQGLSQDINKCFKRYAQR